MMPPVHLEKFDQTANNEFLSDEVVYRRMPSQEAKPQQSVFNQLRWEDIQAGLSVNRSQYSKKSDVLWAFTEVTEKRECQWTLKPGHVFESKANCFPTKTDEKTNVILTLSHTPQNCNYAHCDIFTENLPVGEPQKRVKIDIKAFISSFFG